MCVSISKVPIFEGDFAVPPCIGSNHKNPFAQDKVWVTLNKKALSNPSLKWAINDFSCEKRKNCLTLHIGVKHYYPGC